MKLEPLRKISFRWLAALAACCLSASPASAAPASHAAPAAPAPAAAGPEPATARKTSPYRAAAKLTPRAQVHYAATWGVDRMRVSYTSSGNLIRFSYRVTDPRRAAALSAKASPPYLVAQRSSVVLQVPVMEKIGQLRQTASPVAGQEYWMVFSNKGNHVRPGDRVNVMIGSFHAEGLVVEGT